jgi:glycosyltransferase involved in cell wall biosynthesis
VTRTVLHFTDSIGYGGAERALLTLLEGLDRRVWNPVLMHHPSEGVSPLLEGARALNVPTRAVDRPGTHSSEGRKALAREILKERPAVFHAHLPWALRCSDALRAAARAAVPAIVATQQLFSEIRHPREILRQRIVAAAVDAYVAVSAGLARRLGQTPLFPRGKIHVIRNAVQAAPFEEAAQAAPRPQREGGPAVALTLARLARHKDLPTLLRAAALVPEARFLIAGEGPERPALEAQLDSLGLRERVTLLGHRDDVPQLLARCDLFVLSSLYEGLPVSILEAMAAGKPVVATAIGGIDEAVADGKTGLLVPTGDPVALSGAIRSLISDPALAQRFGAAGRDRVRAEFSAETLAKQMSDLYESLLDGKRRSGRADA